MYSLEVSKSPCYSQEPYVGTVHHRTEKQYLSQTMAHSSSVTFMLYCYSKGCIDRPLRDESLEKLFS